MPSNCKKCKRKNNCKCLNNCDSSGSDMDNFDEPTNCADLRRECECLGTEPNCGCDNCGNNTSISKNGVGGACSVLQQGGQFSSKEGYLTLAKGFASHAEGSGVCDIEEFLDNFDKEDISGRTGAVFNIAHGVGAHAEGCGTVAFGDCSHSEGGATQAVGDGSHAEGIGNKASGIASHAEGDPTLAQGHASHAEGRNSQALGDASHAEGNGDGGFKTIAQGVGSHAEGDACGANIIACGDGSHAEGSGIKGQIVASGEGSHAEGSNTTASGDFSHAEGCRTIASGDASHAGGEGTIAAGKNTTAVGQYNDKGSTDDGTLFVVGKGTSDNDRQDAFWVNKDGDVFICNDLCVENIQTDKISAKIGDIINICDDVNVNGSVCIDDDLQVDEISAKATDGQITINNDVNINGGGFADFWNINGADYAEYFEWNDGNPENEDRIGYFVQLNNDKIINATDSNNVIGITSSTYGTSGLIGDSQESGWQAANLRDDFGRIQIKFSYKQKLIDILNKYKIENTNQIDTILNSEDSELMKNNLIEAELYFTKENIDIDSVKEEIRNVTPTGVAIPNPDYDPDQIYIPRSNRKEWTPVGLMGKMFVRDNGQCIVGQKCDCQNGIAIPGTNWHVIGRSAANVIKVLYHMK